ncbi:hypothetical protein E2R32_05700 [Rathayibacter toxicus]|nr:relaxase domain-containing protein [Rathayibacter toxicus]QOD09527.1 relaxase domain-containing protein [Rathayibacter toxicus]QWL26102.1 hypothetical protein E2R32_05700 [Rathayibacter toxicus]QWL28196.1 hypothetical protein E2R33_05940 [Rathayibacter toxicus]QWL30275.1 hypothetical protein E2R34_05620 [Rathayibacter toxicus]
MDPTAGFDLKFSVSKSVSTLWAVSDTGTQALIAQAHHARCRTCWRSSSTMSR